MSASAKLFIGLAVLVFSLGASQAWSAPKGGSSSGHISQQGMTNSNGPNSHDRDFGKDRAGDRDDRTKHNANSNGKKKSLDRDHGRDRAADRHER